jgi:hypothetical protein
MAFIQQSTTATNEQGGWIFVDIEIEETRWSELFDLFNTPEWQIKFDQGVNEGWIRKL